METHIFLDLTGITSPLDLLKCKSCLNTMKKGQVLEVRIEDQEVVQTLTLIVQRSGDELVYMRENPTGTCLGIRKG